ncbi:hypothetical protein BRARA_C01886 [Brassica rapa]|uniref:Uncharacterized protein n=1 Tax=Brassica campestris TaxID=3711 RepID=A0A397ZXE1_BRACM|nr:hypothetical protein BRARA_C01886 [Brassica rapa]
MFPGTSHHHCPEATASLRLPIEMKQELSMCIILVQSHLTAQCSQRSIYEKLNTYLRWGCRLLLDEKVDTLEGQSHTRKQQK